MCISGLFCNRKDVRNRRLTKRNDGLVAFSRHFRHTGDRKERQVAEMTTGEKIAALRKEQGMSQEALGEKLGLSRQAVSKWEADQAVPTMDNLMELSKLFGVPVDTLLRPDAELMPKAEDSVQRTSRSGAATASGKLRRLQRRDCCASALCAVRSACGVCSPCRSRSTRCGCRAGRVRFTIRIIRALRTAI